MKTFRDWEQQRQLKGGGEKLQRWQFGVRVLGDGELKWDPGLKSLEEEEKHPNPLNSSDTSGERFPKQTLTQYQLESGSAPQVSAGGSSGSKHLILVVEELKGRILNDQNCSLLCSNTACCTFVVLSNVRAPNATRQHSLWRCCAEQTPNDNYRQNLMRLMQTPNHSMFDSEHPSVMQSYWHLNLSHPQLFQNRREIITQHIQLTPRFKTLEWK